jgi:ABC-type nitrate/sulfonate/bicarbonate transport system substrate-binding protein
MIAAALLLLATAVSSTPLGDARRIAETGTPATLGPIKAMHDTTDLIDAHPELTPAEINELGDVAKAIEADHAARLRDAEVSALLQYLSPEDLRALADFTRTPAAEHLRANLLAVFLKTATVNRDFDFKAEVAKAFCAKSGKLCAR